MAQKKPLGTFEKVTIKGARRAVRKIAEALQERVITNATLADHSLDQLEKLGHPYAVRGTQTLHSPNFQVHAQSGRLSENIVMEKVSDDEYIVGVDDAKVPYVRHVIRGTQFMIPRDFITGSFKEIEKKFSKIFTDGVARAVRSVRGETSKAE